MNKFQEFLSTYTNLKNNLNKLFLNSNNLNINLYTSTLLFRLMFLYFIQKKGFFNNDLGYLRTCLEISKQKGKNLYLSDTLNNIFKSIYIFSNNNLDCDSITIPDELFESIFESFDNYEWILTENISKDPKILPYNVISYIYETEVDQRTLGAFYTPKELVDYCCSETIPKFILTKLGKDTNIDLYDLINNSDINILNNLIGILGNLTILDPACGAGAFLEGSFKVLFNIYKHIYSKLNQLNKNTPHQNYTNYLDTIENTYGSLEYYLSLNIILNNLYGVELNQYTLEIARINLILISLSVCNSIKDIKQLPCLNFNIKPGNSLIGYLNIDEIKDLNPTFINECIKMEHLIREYKGTHLNDPDNAAKLSESINQIKTTINTELNYKLLNWMINKKIKYERSNYNDITNTFSTTKEPLNISHIQSLNTFHWCLEFFNIISDKGFDIILGNPPWLINKSRPKEFFKQYSIDITVNKTTSLEFKNIQNNLLQNTNIKESYLNYLNQFQLTNAYYRNTPILKRNNPNINGKNYNNSDSIHTHFLHQSYNLLKPSGYCGIIVPSGFYSNAGSAGIREFIFKKTKIKSLIGFENKRKIFKNVDSFVKFIALIFERGGHTTEFKTAFRQHYLSSLNLFQKNEIGYTLTMDLIKKISPDTLTILELKSQIDVNIINKMILYPTLNTISNNTWNVKISQEFNYTKRLKYYTTQYNKDLLTIFDGKQIHQFQHNWAPPKYYIPKELGRKLLLKTKQDINQNLDYQNYRLVYRGIASCYNQRTLIATIIPKNVICQNTLPILNTNATNSDNLVILAILNSFVVDYYLRLSVITTINYPYVYHLPVPRITESHPDYKFLMISAAKLVCTDELYESLWNEVMDSEWTPNSGITDPNERTQIRSQIDAKIAHIYNLTETEFKHIIDTFTIVPQDHKNLSLEYFKEFAESK